MILKANNLYTHRLLQSSITISPSFIIMFSDDTQALPSSLLPVTVVVIVTLQARCTSLLNRDTDA